MSGAQPADAADNPGVITIPPLIPFAALLLGLALDWLLPAPVLTIVFSFQTRLAIGIVLIGAGIALMVAGAHWFHKAGTNVEPWKPALRLVTTGVYGWMRNPIYVGFWLVATGLAFAIASEWTLVLLVPAGVVLHYGIVLREERYLEAKFGDAYREYRQHVPRYGWPV